jgi:hypothetical protein
VHGRDGQKTAENQSAPAMLEHPGARPKPNSEVSAMSKLPLHVSARKPEIARILRASFPNYRKREVIVDVFRGSMTVNSYWDGGSKDEYVLLRLDNGRAAKVPTSHPYFDRRSDGSRCGTIELRELPPNTVLVHGGYFCGKPRLIYIYCRPDGLAKQLEAPADPADELPRPQQRALNIIAGIKGGCRPEYFERAGLSKYGPDNVYVRALAARGLIKISKAGAVQATIEGENARNAFATACF